VRTTDNLATARRLLERPDAKTAGIWSRAGALLARQALEETLDAFWRGKGLRLEALSTRAQLICLPRYLDDERLAADVGHAWAALTQACHHHPYELPRTAGELRTWLEVAERFTERADLRS
jgi:hypothetical protein